MENLWAFALLCLAVAVVGGLVIRAFAGWEFPVADREKLTNRLD
jgi:hypothetical protein